MGKNKKISNEYYLLKDGEGNYLYNFEIMKSPYSNTGDVWTKTIANPDFAVRFTKKYLAEAIAKALKMEVVKHEIHHDKRQKDI